LPREPIHKVVARFLAEVDHYVSAEDNVENAHVTEWLQEIQGCEVDKTPDHLTDPAG
jgi:hypothetical protein